MPRHALLISLVFVPSVASAQNMKETGEFLAIERGALRIKLNNGENRLPLARQVTVEDEDGKPLTTKDLKVGQFVTVVFEPRKGWSKIMLTKPTKPDLDPRQLQVDVEGQFKADVKFTVAEVIDKTRMVVTWGKMTLFLKGFSTKGLVDGAKLEISDVVKVTDTIKHRGQTMFLIEPAKSEKKQDEKKP